MMDGPWGLEANRGGPLLLVIVKGSSSTILLYSLAEFDDRYYHGALNEKDFIWLNRKSPLFF